MPPTQQVLRLRDQAGNLHDPRILLRQVPGDPAALEWSLVVVEQAPTRILSSATTLNQPLELGTRPGTYETRYVGVRFAPAGEYPVQVVIRDASGDTLLFDDVVESHLTIDHAIHVGDDAQLVIMAPAAPGVDVNYRIVEVPTA